MDIPQLEELIAKLRALGVTEYKHEGIELKLGPPPAPPPVRVPLEDQEKFRKKKEAYEEMLLFGSSEGFYEPGEDTRQ